MAVIGENSLVSGCSNSSEISKHSVVFKILFPSVCFQTQLVTTSNKHTGTFHSTIKGTTITIVLNCYVQQHVLEPTSGHTGVQQNRGQET